MQPGSLTGFCHSFLNIRSANRPLTKHGVGFGLWKEGRGERKEETNRRRRQTVCSPTRGRGAVAASASAASVTTQEIGIGLHFLFPIALCTHPRAACEGRAHTATQSTELQVDHGAPHQKSRACPIERGESRRALLMSRFTSSFVKFSSRSCKE